MLRDVFYLGSKPNVHPREQLAASLDDARNKAVTKDFWLVNEFCDYSGFDWDFDFEFLPDEDVWAEEHNNVWPSQHQKDSGTWLCPKQKSDIIVYRNDVNPVYRKSAEKRWVELDLINHSEFDFTWHPDPTVEPYIYKWGCKYYPVQFKAVLEYHVPGATQIKYMDSVVDLLPKLECWTIAEAYDVTSFDLRWRPDPREPNFTYVFGNKYCTRILEYAEPSASSDRKYITDPNLKLDTSSIMKMFEHLEDADGIDYTWRPDPDSPPYIYVWGNQWYSSEEYTSIRFVVPGATDCHYMTDRATRKPTMAHWEIPVGVDTSTFDFSWMPHPKSPAYTYQFGTIADPTDGPIYHTPNSSGEIVNLLRVESKDYAVDQYSLTTTLADLVEQHPTELFWAVNPDLDYSTFDFSWRPSIEQAKYVHVFGAKDSPNTQTYFVNGPQFKAGNSQLNYVESVELSLKPKLDLFYVDRGNGEASDRFLKLQQQFGNRIQKTRYINSWVDTINRCANRTTGKLFWVLNSELDYTGFNFDYYPNTWQMSMVHVFGTQWSHWGSTFLLNKETFPTDTKYIKVIEHLSNLNFVKEIRARATSCLYDVVYIDFGNNESNNMLTSLKNRLPNTNISTVVYDQDYLTTLRTIINRQQKRDKDHYLWIVSSICDYSSFDFSYICDPFAKEQLHVFPSGKQKFGDTFLLDVNNSRTELEECTETLREISKINYTSAVKASRLPEPIIVTTDDTQVNAIHKLSGFPYSRIVSSTDSNLADIPVEPMSMWSADTKNLTVLSTGATAIIAPIEVKNYEIGELYDYPYINKQLPLAQSSPMDIVFLSNGEANAEENWNRLLSVTSGLKNRVVRVDGVNGRVAAYHAAANASNTPWFFAVFGKLSVNAKFDFFWQPDRLQIPKHYIFYAKNPVNDLEYGHQGMIAYNKRLVLANPGLGLDFTLDDPHEVVPIISGTANYNTDSWSTWRAAFREVIKLKHDSSSESLNRLEKWTSPGKGQFAEYSQRGANDALEYYEQCLGNIEQLKLSYEWNWLRKRFDEKLG